MKEILDIYDSNKVKTAKTYIRGSNNLKQDEYVIVIEVAIINSNNQILLSQRSGNKKLNPLKWETTQGSVKSGEDSKLATVRELNEELGISLNKENLNYFKTIKDDEEHIFKDMFCIKENIDLNSIKFTDNEVIDVKLVDIDEFYKMNKSNQLASNMNFNLENLKQLVDLMNNI